MSGDLAIRNVRILGGPTVDLVIRGGRIAAIGVGLAAPGIPALDGKGRLLLPGLVESHTHLDKTLWGLPWRPNSAGPTLKDYIENERRILREVTVPIARRAGGLLEACIARGTLHFRSHIDIDPEFGLAHVEAMLALRERYRDIAEMQFVVFPQTGLLIRPGTAALMEEAIKLGVETVGGLDPAGIDRDPIRHLETVFGLAGKYGRGVDIHLHDREESGVWQIERIADFTAATGLKGKVMVSHAYCLGQVPRARIEALAQRLADLEISLMTSAPADTEIPPATWLREIGVNICCGSDGIRDAWSPFGNGDMLERAMLLAYRLDWSKDEMLAAALATVTDNGARALGLHDYGIAVGHEANLVLVEAETIGDAVVRRPAERTVIARGKVVAKDGKFIDSRL
ncbi:cytosine deaminase [Hypericibacter adhaerens]|uniref:Cytosine deaminase n=1 Tax=Hypericibacter adhaerens TaxID=2602016 RepID=A0A5J6MY34_9PROT|nr:amidohydrolase family protein [Hypericibacter adhaerens]QEX22598.1 cytosine deaminase [Hypericibacter adhaerens]